MLHETRVGVVNALVLLALPAVTGLASALWAQITAASRLTTAGLNVLSYAAVMLIVAMADGPALPCALPGLAVAYVLASVAVSLLWFRAAPTAPIGVLALAESSWPLFAIAFSWAMGEPTRLSVTGWIGAGLVMVGAPLIAIGGSSCL